MVRHLSPLLLLFAPLLARQGVDVERAFPYLRFERPVYLTGAGDGSGRLFVVEQEGVIRVFPGDDEEVRDSEVFLDLRERVSRKGNEEGLLGLAFAPDFAESGTFYVHYSSSVKDEVGVVARFRVSDDDPDRADPDSEQVVLEQSQPWRNHNGGPIAFGPDGMLYVSFGDGGSANDPHGNGQDLETWLGSILRIDVSTHPYTVPPDNPFAGREDARPEIWAYGLRNVWRFSFDRETGALWAGDVGQDSWEEVDRIERGKNYGWDAYEASHPFPKAETELDPAEHTPPVAEYGRDLGISITGGYVYRGERYPSLRGLYFYGDYATGNLWSLDVDELPDAEPRLVRHTGRSIASFGEDDAGELYLTSFDGGIYRIVPSDAPVDELADWPDLLSETGLFADTAAHEPAEHLVAYDINVPFWSDGATKERFLVLPEGEALGYRAGDAAFDLPVGTTVVKSFRGRTMGREQLLETRLIRRRSDGWEAATYVWDHDRGDAVLAPGGRQFELYRRGPGRTVDVASWHAPSSAECSRCHVADFGFVLGFTAAQLDRDGQLEDWAERELLAGYEAGTAEPLPRPGDERQPVAAHARAWLDVNCAMCHRPDGPGNAAIDLRVGTPLEDTGVVDVPPTRGELGIEGARLVAPGEPARSLLLHRVATLGDGRMPDLATNLVDERGVALLTAWIAGLGEDDGWVSLFDGETLDGWSRRNGSAAYRVEDGAIVGRTAEGSPNSFLCTNRGYDDFELRFQVRVHDRLNSGVQLRSDTRGGPDGRVNGPQVEIESSGENGAEAGYLYAEAAGGWMTPDEQRVPAHHFQDGEWNDYRVRAVRPTIQVWIDGAQVSDLTHEAMYRSHPRGFLGLQVHSIPRGQGPYEVRWRDLELRELRPAAAGWRRLVQGRELDGWFTEGNWQVRGDELVIDPRPGEEGWQRYEDYLTTEARFGDFVLDLEYAYNEGGNSGVFFRVDDPSDPVETGVEAQILDSWGKEGPMTHHDHAGIIRTAGASHNMSRPAGEWNRMVVVMRGSRVQVELNGREVVDHELEDVAEEGHVALQDHGEPHVVRFRNLWLKEL